VKNLFVTDGSTFPTSSEKNPTLTIMALSLRAADYIKERRKRGEL
jgi:choline dehydrogenase-like flavoprotein